MFARPFTGGSESADSLTASLEESTDADVARPVPVLIPDLIEPDLDDSVADAVLGAAVDVSDSQPDRPLCSTSDFASIYVRSRRSLEIRARSFLSDPRDVEEVVQETFLRLVLAMPELEFEWQAHAFCRRVLTNLCIDRYRRDRRRPQVYDLDSARAEELAATEFTDHPVLRAEDAAVVREALSCLSPTHRTALVMREIEERPLADIATALDIPEERVKHLLYRARRSLRRVLTGSAVDPDVDLTLGELVAAANRRMAAATLQTGHAVVAFLAVGLLIAVCSRGVVPQRDSSSVTPTTGSTGSTGATEQRTRRAARAPAVRHPATRRSTGDSRTVPATRSVVPAPTVPPTVPVPRAAHEGSAPQSEPSSPPPSPSTGSAGAHAAAAPYTVTVGRQTMVAALSSAAALSGASTRIASTLRVAGVGTSGGSYVVSKSLSSTSAAPTTAAEIDQASLTLTLPPEETGGSPTVEALTDGPSYELTQPQVTVVSARGGAVLVTLTGVAVALASDVASAPAAVAVTLTDTYVGELGSLRKESAVLSPLPISIPLPAAA